MKLAKDMRGLGRAIVVEDDPSWQEILVEILEDVGLEVDVADNLDNAVQLLREWAHRVAVVDLSLRGSDPHNQDGLAILNAIRRQDPGCAGILLTGYATVELAVSALTEYGAISCLRKETFQRDQFRLLVQEVLDRPPGPVSGSGEPGGPSASEPDREAEEAAPVGSRILLVEDDAGWREIAAELLTDAGYQLRLCSSYGEAVGCLRRERYELAVVDLSLSSAGQSGQDLDGFQVLKTAQDAGISAMVLSGTAGMGDVDRAYEQYDIVAYVQKQSFDRRFFLEMVAELLEEVKGPGAVDLGTLSTREREVLDLLAQGMTNKEIAEALVISTNTVKRHLKSIFSKLEVHTRAAAAARALGR